MVLGVCLVCFAYSCGLVSSGCFSVLCVPLAYPSWWVPGGMVTSGGFEVRGFTRV
jgi:hypothetical protein